MLTMATVNKPEGTKFVVFYSEMTPYLDMLLRSLQELGVEVSGPVIRKAASVGGKDFTEKSVSFEIHDETTIRNAASVLGVPFRQESKIYVTSLG